MVQRYRDHPPLGSSKRRGKVGNYPSSLQRPSQSIQWLTVLFLAIFTTLLSTAAYAQPSSRPPRRVCGSVSLRNNITHFEEKLRNCTVVVGYVHIVLLHLQEDDWRDVSFPELEEITEHLLFFQVWGLRSLGKLFPNLAVIRGDYLIQDYALVVNHMKDLSEIGLTHLAYIAQGSVKIDKSPKLCYVDEVNWSQIFETDYILQYDRKRSVSCEPCPDNCNGHCWNSDTCFNAYNDNCHSECVGCMGPQPTDCVSCRNARDKTGRCVERCPEDTILNIETHQCMTIKECKSFWNGMYLHFQGKCMKTCPPKYEQRTNKPNEYLIIDAEPCQYCGDQCKKVCMGKTVDAQSSVRDFHKCTNVNGSMIFKISNPKVAALLTENMRMIKEITGSLTIRRSSMLTSLDFLPNLQRIGSENNVSISVMDNENLARLWNLTNRNISIEEGSRIHFHYNPKLCLSEIRKLTDHLHLEPTELEVPRHSNGETATCDNFTLNTRISEIWPTNVTLVWNYIPGSMFLFYYIENIQRSNYSSCDDIDWLMVTTYTNKITLTQLIPYVNYKYFIKLSTNDTTVPHQTEVQEFHTLSADPNPPENVLAISDRYDRMVVSWDPPLVLNGNLSHYLLIRHLEPDVEEYLIQRDYCKDQFSIQTAATLSARLVNKPTKPVAVSQEDGTCKCKKKSAVEVEFRIKDAFTELCDYLQGSGDRGGISVGCRPYRYITGDTHRYNKRLDYGRPHIEETRIDTDATSFEIENLDPYSMYVFFLAACNINRTMESQCSEVVMVYNRTRRKDDADKIISGVTVKVENSDVTISWSEPPLFNSILLTYEIEFKDKLPVTCLSRHESQLLNFIYHFSKLFPGEYHVRMRATSLAGPGEFTAFVMFEIEEKGGDSINLFVLFLIVLPLVVIVVGLVVWWFWYKRRLRNVLIKRINPEYKECRFDVDEWEMERDDIEIMEVLGEGTFGLVNTGFIKSTNRYCAVKSMNPEVKPHDKEDFLQEATVMKSFNTHHVVKLIGIVSRSINGSTPLVIMELMTRGDLKGYLRQSRDSSTSITCAELYRMAIQIADGMAYLSAKKYIHRDLAARNCMVSADHTVKIGDFGMARDIYFNDYYRKETKGLLPIRWMAPESLRDGVFTSDSDAWSYGIVLWEMMTLAEQPYQGLANEQVFQYVTAHGTLERPTGCPDIIWDIMSGCWNWRPTARPLFSDVVVTLEPNVGPDFHAVSFYHSNEGVEYRITNRERPQNVAALSLRHQNINGSNNVGVRWSVDDNDGDHIALYNGDDVDVINRHDGNTGYLAMGVLRNVAMVEQKDDVVKIGL